MSVVGGQTAGWIKMPLGREVDLGPGDIVLDGDPAFPVPPPKGTAASPCIWPMSVVAKQSPISATAEHLYCIKEENIVYVKFLLWDFHY